MLFSGGRVGQRYLCHGRALLTSLLSLSLSSFSDTFLARLFQSSHVVVVSGATSGTGTCCKNYYEMFSESPILGSVRFILGLN